MIVSLWPSQNISRSITQAAARLHIEHWMNVMVHLRKGKRDAIAHIPSVLLGMVCQATDSR
jgi:hypothetical protein